MPLKQNLDSPPKTIVITGATSGIGLSTALQIASKNHNLVIICRDKSKSDSAKLSIINQTGNKNIKLILSDFSSLKSVDAACSVLQNEFDYIDVLINNAAVFTNKKELSAEGYELQFAVNYLAPFLLTNGIVNLLKKSSMGRVVNVASQTHKNTTLDFNDLFSNKKPYNPIDVYAKTKLANVMFSNYFAALHYNEGITSNSLHPGVAATNLLADYHKISRDSLSLNSNKYSSTDSASLTSVYLALSNEVKDITGNYFVECRNTAPSEFAANKKNQQKLWEISMELTNIIP